MKIAINLHDIKKIILIEHEDCGAYKVTYNNKNYDKKYHEDNMKIFKNNFDLLKDDLSKNNDDFDYINKIKELTLEFYMIDLKGNMTKIDI